MTEEQLTAIINQQSVVIEAQKQLLIAKTEEYLKAQASYGEELLKYHGAQDAMETLVQMDSELENQKSIRAAAEAKVFSNNLLINALEYDLSKAKAKASSAPSKAAVIISVITTLFNIYWILFH